jgi:hypothetical protein
MLADSLQQQLKQGLWIMAGVVLLRCPGLQDKRGINARQWACYPGKLPIQ